MSCVKGRCKLFCVLFLLAATAVVVYTVSTYATEFGLKWSTPSASMARDWLQKKLPIGSNSQPNDSQYDNRLKFDNVVPKPPMQVVSNEGNGENVRPGENNMKTAVQVEPLGKDLTGMHRLVHLDLKGAPPKTSFYKTAFPFFRQQGATGLLIEYEDMFPYKDALSPLRSDISYTQDDIAKILSLAKENNLEVIPLVQTFGHLEFVLKNEQFASIREVFSKPQNLNPAKEKSLQVVMAMIDQVLSLHPDAKWIHIGCDEVYYLGKSPESQMLMRKKGLSRSGLFLHHVTAVARYINKKYEGVKPIIWDDMMRRLTRSDIQRSGLPELVEPMIWQYTHYLDQTLPSNMWAKYAQLFKNVWAASAFKGATGPAQFYTDHAYHLENHRQWITIINRLQDKTLNFRGIALTGWQRYDHFGALCELLPVAFPCLSMCLQSLQMRRPWSQDNTTQMYEKLGCSVLEEQTSSKKPVYHCEKMPGDKVYIGAQRLANLLIYYDRAKESAGAWFNNYLVSRRYLSPGRLFAMIHGRRYDAFMSNISSLEDYMQKALAEIYDEDTVVEWLDVNIWSKVKELKDLHEKSLPYLTMSSWQRRPLPVQVITPPPPAPSTTTTTTTTTTETPTATTTSIQRDKDRTAEKDENQVIQSKQSQYGQQPQAIGNVQVGQTFISPNDQQRAAQINNNNLLPRQPGDGKLQPDVNAARPQGYQGQIFPGQRLLPQQQALQNAQNRLPGQYGVQQPQNRFGQMQNNFVGMRSQNFGPGNSLQPSLSAFGGQQQSLGGNLQNAVQRPVGSLSNPYASSAGSSVQNQSPQGPVSSNVGQNPEAVKSKDASQQNTVADNSPSDKNIQQKPGPIGGDTQNVNILPKNIALPTNSIQNQNEKQTSLNALLKGYQTDEDKNSHVDSQAAVNRDQISKSPSEVNDGKHKSRLQISLQTESPILKPRDTDVQKRRISVSQLQKKRRKKQKKTKQTSKD